jgi:hypothetical protein
MITAITQRWEERVKKRKIKSDSGTRRPVRILNTRSQRSITHPNGRVI